MLTIAKLGVGQESYYLSKVAQGIEDYYSGKGEVPGVWIGRGAARLGLVGEVAGAELRAVLGGIDPATGQRLAGREGVKRVPGWDLTFSAPKSVSVLYALGGDGTAKEVVAAHQEAVAAGLAYLERHATVSRRRVDGEIEQVRGEGLVVAAFRHRTSRAGDPQLHSHALVPNVVERVDGGSGALHSPVIYRHARTAGFVYQAVLRGGLTHRLGADWDPVHNGHAEIAGVDRRLLEGFSKRRAEIERTLSERGEDSARAAQVAAHRTRAAKDYDVDPETLHERWHTEAQRFGVDPAGLGELLGRPGVHVAEQGVQDIVDEMVSPVGLTAQQASFDHRDVIRAWCAALPPGTEVTLDRLEQLAALLETDARVVPVVDGRRRLRAGTALVGAGGEVTGATAGEGRWSTTEMLDVEGRLLTTNATPAGRAPGRVRAEVVEAVLEQRLDLAGEQAAVVRRLTTSGNALELVVGRAGSGKTYALAAAAEIWRGAGYRPVGVGLAARAAHELQTTAGIASTTVAQFLIDADNAPRGVLTDRHVVVVDEAGMVDTRRLARLVRHAELAGAKVVLVGDHHQLPAVEAGGAFAGLVERLGASELAHNRRQREVWERHMLNRLRIGAGGHRGVSEVVATYGERGRLHIGSTPAEIRAAMVADWYAARDSGQVAMVALRRADVDELNWRARALLVADGTVADGGVEAGERTFAVGDRVVCLENDRRLGVHNAMFGTIGHVDGENQTVTMQPDDGSPARVLPHSYLADSVDHAYATTIHKAQGATYDRVLLLGDDRLYRQAGYTGLSRGRDRNDVYLVVDDDREHDPTLERHGGRGEDDGPVDRLVRALHRDGAKLLASDERDTEPIGCARPLAVLWAERDDLAQRLAADIPATPAPESLGGEADAVDAARAREAQAVLERGVTEERVGRLGGVRHRRERLQAQRQLERAVAREHRLTQIRQDLEVELSADNTAASATQEWLLAHRGDLGHLDALDHAIERRTRLAGHAAEIDRPSHVIDVLGEPPRDLDGRARWRMAAGAIESYRARWHHDVIVDDDVAVRDLPADHAAQLAVVRRAIDAVETPPGEGIDELT